MQGLTLIFRQGGDWKCCLMQETTLQNKMHYYSQMMLPSAYWLLSLFKPVSKYNNAPLRQKKLWLFIKSRNVHMLCSCRKQPLPHCWLQMIYNWANNSLTSKGYEQNVHTCLRSTLTLISKQAHLLTTTHAANSPVNSKRHRSIYGNGLFAYRPTAALIGYSAPGPVLHVNAIVSYSDF